MNLTDITIIVGVVFKWITIGLALTWTVSAIVTDNAQNSRFPNISTHDYVKLVIITLFWYKVIMSFN